MDASPSFELKSIPGASSDILRGSDRKGKPEEDFPSSVVTSVYSGLSTSRDQSADGSYRLYRRRFAGLLGFILLNLVGGMSWPWFGPIANDMVDEFGISLNRVTWLGNIVACIYVPTALLIPTFIARYGIRRCCDIGAIALILAAWIRYAGTPRSLSPNGAYALLILGQFFASIAQPIFQVLGPKYSETWFNLNGRTTATMLISIANPIGGGIGQLISPLIEDTRKSILILGIICTVAAPCVFLISSAPPTPPTYAGSKKSPSISSLVRAMLGREDDPDAHMGLRERIDFAIITIIFGVLVAGINAFAILTAQDLNPVGYSDDTAGLMGATLLITGIVAAIVTAPLFDRVFTHHLAITAKIMVPILAGAWLSLIWAVKPHDTGGLYAIMTILGVASITMLPVSLELACDVTRNADGSSAILWTSGNLLCVVFLLAEDALREGPDADPPLNMHKALIFNGAFIVAASSLVFLLRGKQVRKELDEANLVSQQETQRVTGEQQA